MRLRLFLASAFLALAGCSAGPISAQEQTAVLPADAAVLPGSAVGQMLRQCSRSAPAPGEATWQPTAGDVAALETALAAALRGREEIARDHYATDPDWALAPRGWWRQYVGIVRSGRRFIYGNFYPRRPENAQLPNWRTAPVGICDGGPVFFGAEWDVAAHRFTQIAFNGALG
ncbi:MAG TPA: hypothetical protein VEW04_10180 [Allosphingosinicella sp.]|nr:hypothetical protein [Allosphingosinicella sp.]